MAFDRLLGEAYILMRADGTLIPRDVKKSGEKAGKGWSKAFDKELKAAEKGSLARFRRNLAVSTNDIDFSRFRKEFGTVDQTVDGVNERLRELRESNRITEKSANKVTKALNQWAESAHGVAAETKRISDTKKGLTQFFKDQEAGLKRQQRVLDDQNAAWLTYGRNVEHTMTAQQRAIDAQNKAWLTYGVNVKHTMGEQTRAIEDQNAAWLTYGRNVQHTLGSQQRAIDDQNAAWLTYGRNLVAADEKLKAHTKTLDRHSSSWVRNARSVRLGLDATAERADHLGSIIGRAFGKGSRNNFLNWVGSMVGGMVRLGTAVITFPAKAVAHVVDSFGSAFSAARETLGFLPSVGKGIGAVFGGAGGVVGLVGGAAAAFFALSKALPTIISLMTLMAGAATALVGSIGIGLTGALLGVTPAAIGAVAALGGVFAAITVFRQDKDNKDFMEKIFTKPLEKFAKQFYPQMRTFFRTVSSGWKRLLAEITPSTKAFFDSFESKFKDKSTQAALDKWADSLGRMATSVSNAVTSFGSGFVGFFTPVLPYAERLTTYIENIAARFDKWANSKPGQNAIADFMHDAWIDAKLVWDILGEIGSIFATVFSSGDNTGVTFLEGIRSKLEKIDAFLKTPGGRKKLDDFFGDAKEIGTAIGGIATDIGGLVKDLSSPEGRQGAKDIMGSIKGLADSAADVLEVTGAITGLLTKIEEFMNKINPLANPLKNIWDLGSKILGLSEEHGKEPKPTPGPITGPAPNLGLGGGARPVPTAPIVPDMSKFKKAIQDFKFTIPVDATVWKQVSKIVQDFVFYNKKVPIEGNVAAWNVAKGTVAGYAFEPKVVKIVPHGDEVYDWVAKWNRLSIKTKTARINVGVSKGGGKDLTGGQVMARGGILTGPTHVLAGEAGREAFVPLDRPLNQVDPSVRALSAIAQGLKPPAMAAGGVVGGGGANIVVEAGALQVTTAATNPNAVGRVVLNRLGDVLAAAGA